MSKEEVEKIMKQFYKAADELSKAMNMMYKPKEIKHWMERAGFEIRVIGEAIEIVKKEIKED